MPSLSDKPEWKCNGQLLTFTLPLTDQVSVIKAKIFEELMMPAGKQKLQYEVSIDKRKHRSDTSSILPSDRGDCTPCA